MEILLFKFNKKSNSTKVPDDSSGVTVQVSVKQNVMGGREGFSKDCFVVTPTFFINANSGLTPDKATCYNYCKAFGRYYFIRNAMVDISNAITLFCEVDALATLKSEILNTTARVLYSSSHGSNQIDDSRNGPTANTVLDWETAQVFDQTGDGTYILNVIGTSTSSDASPFSVTYLIGNGAIGSAFAASMLSETFASNLSKYWNDAQNFVVSLKWTPITIPYTLTDPLEHICVGEYDTGVAARPFKVRFYGIETVELQVPKRYSDYRQSAKYVDYVLNIPYCGSQRIPVSILKGESIIKLTPVLDLITGDVAIRITTGNGVVIGLASGNCYSDLPIAVESGRVKNALAVTGAALAAGAAIVTGGTGIATAAEAGSTIASVTRTAVGVAHLANAAQTALGAVGHEQTELTRGGALSSAVGGIVLPVAELVENAHDSVFNPTELQTIRGLPYGKTILLNNLSGYCQTEGAQIDTSDYAEIIYIANKQMDAGFYIE